jgi:hypothetical protein
MIKDQIGRKLLGAGWGRAVFDHKLDKTLAIKVAHRHLTTERNLMEWEIWNNAPKHIKKWLVPCVSIHEDGAYLVCKKGKNVDKAPDGNPFGAIFHDTLMPKNWVSIDGKTLLADYANSPMYNLYGKK